VILAVDASRLLGARTGVGRALEDLLVSWSREPNLPFEQIDLYSREPIPRISLDERFRLHVLPSSVPGPWWRTVRLGPRTRAHDVLLAQHMLPVGFRGRSVLLHHGITEARHGPPPWDLQARMRRWHYRYSARRATIVIANSDQLREGLVRYYKIPPGKIQVSYPAVRELFRPARPGEEEEVARTAEGFLGERAPYVLFVGMLTERRHIPELIKAFARVPGGRHRLLIVGPYRARLSVPGLAEQAGIGQRVHHVEFLDHHALALLYRGASAFCLPTTQESWSHTIGEALASGCPVITVNGPWLEPEAVRKAVVALPAPGVEELSGSLTRVLADEEFAQGLRRRGLQAAAAFRGPDDFAREVMEVLVRVARSDDGRSGR
jgi:glycosyltransferase involved in cell wall biosynthesis